MKKFIQLIDLFLLSEIDYDQFYSSFNDLYFGQSHIEENKQLRREESEFLDEINEEMFFAAKDPNNEDKQKYNYIDQNQFSKWLKHTKEKNIKFWE